MVPRGNPDNLRAAAQRKRQAATERAQTALDALITAGEPITFRGLAKTAGVSIDFLYRSPLRARVEQLRAEQQRTPPAPAEPEPEAPPSPALMETLTARRDTATDPELRLLVHEQLMSVRRALPSLTASERAGLAMAVNGQSPTQLASRLPGSPHAASQAAHRARRKLAAALAA